MKTFKIKDGDLVINKSGNLEMVDGKDEVAQSVEMILTTNEGEWFLNEEFGLDYDTLTSKGQTPKDIKYLIREAVYKDERIEEVVFTKLDIDSSKRHIDVALKLKTDDNQVLELGVSV